VLVREELGSEDSGVKVALGRVSTQEVDADSVMLAMVTHLNNHVAKAVLLALVNDVEGVHVLPALQAQRPPPPGVAARKKKPLPNPLNQTHAAHP
jgi:hypothetical protein